MPCTAGRGILLHGAPGCGKTLAVRAVAGACAAGAAPVALFARTAADCLGKFYGGAERTLRLLFEEVGALNPEPAAPAPAVAPPEAPTSTPVQALSPSHTAQHDDVCSVSRCCTG